MADQARRTGNEDSHRQHLLLSAHGGVSVVIRPRQRDDLRKALRQASVQWFSERASI